jgi:dTDP-4-amino-4,6-dideoxygalactose transaminase
VVAEIRARQERRGHRPPTREAVEQAPGHTPEDVPVSTAVGRRLFCPAVHPLMSDDDLRYVAAAVKASMRAVARETGLLAAVA